MWFTPASTTRRRMASAPARSPGGPNTPGPGSCMAPKPMRRTGRPASRFTVSVSVMAPACRAGGPARTAAEVRGSHSQVRTRPGRRRLRWSARRLGSPSVDRVARRPTVTHRGKYAFACPPEQLWRAMEEADQFESWWSWLSEFRLDGGVLVPGEVLRGVVAPPLPYRMRIRVELTECEPFRRILAAVSGDLEGEARLELRGSDVGSSVDVSW